MKKERTYLALIWPVKKMASQKIEPLIT